MPKKPTAANIKAAAEFGIKYRGSPEAAIESYRYAIKWAEKTNDAGAVETYQRLIAYCEEVQAKYAADGTVAA